MRNYFFGFFLLFLVSCQTNREYFIEVYVIPAGDSYIEVSIPVEKNPTTSAEVPVSVIPK